MIKYKIKTETNSITKEVRYRIKERFLYFFWLDCEFEGGKDAVFSSEDNAKDIIDYNIKEDNWK